MKIHPKVHPLWHLVLLVASAASLSSCAAPIVPRQVPFHETDFARSRGTGSGSVGGQVFITMTNGDTQVGPNVDLVLMPVNAYTAETIQKKYIGGENLAEGDPSYSKFLRTARADGKGYFAFRQIPPGDYYVGTAVEWSHWIWNTNSDGSMYKITIHRSTMIYARVSVGNGQEATVTQWMQGKSKLLNHLSDS